MRAARPASMLSARVARQRASSTRWPSASAQFLRRARRRCCSSSRPTPTGSAPRLRRALRASLLLPVAICFMLAPAALGIGRGVRAGLPAHRRQHGRRRRRPPAAAAAARLLGAAIVGAMLIAFAGAQHLDRDVCRPLPAAADGADRSCLVDLPASAALGMQLMTFEDMTYELRQTNRRLEAAQSELRQLVITDALTGTRNRRFFDEVIGRELQRHRRYRHAAVDRLHRHRSLQGDQRHAGARDRRPRPARGRGVPAAQHPRGGLRVPLGRRRVPGADLLRRAGGDPRAAASCRTRSPRSPQLVDLPPGVGLSIGCVEVPPETDDIMPLIQVADERMYADKKRRETMLTAPSSRLQVTKLRASLRASGLRDLVRTSASRIQQVLRAQQPPPGFGRPPRTRRSRRGRRRS